MSTRPTSGASQGGTRRVNLVVPRLDATHVVATGDFSAWSAEGIRLKRRRDGCWAAALAVSPGEHQYRLLVDGEWRNNPGAERRVPNGFGSENDVLVAK